MRRVRRRGGNKEKVFGCDLLVHLNASSQEIPQVLRCCSEFVETHGIVDGIYRLSGVSSNTQKLRSEFESEGSPDLNKDLYLQDIHCVSSLCKAYFRELPNPLLTYQLYDKFAEAVSIQLEEDRLVKIRDVLQELPTPHYRTLEFLMRHLVRMASHSSETNMHARNLAIVWAPNLLRSKDIELAGFNGKAAFMEVRVQSIVVEFILTHVPQLFPEHDSDVSCQRRKSLPSPSAVCNQEEGGFKPTFTQPVPNFGLISPGDGPLPIRPYHAIIEGTDKRKGSLKGRKWMSIFNIGGRFHKHSSKEKDRHILRPARSMDSLRTPSSPKEGSLRITQSPPSADTSLTSYVVTPPLRSGSDVAASSSASSGSEYAVTYRRGTGLVSGGLGTQGTYTALDPDGLGVTGNEAPQLRSPGHISKGRRAAMRITGPTMVTVPLHITSNLALGVLQGGGGDRIVHCSWEKDEGDKAECVEGGERVEMRETRGMEWTVDDRGKESKTVVDREVEDTEEKSVGSGDEEEEGETKKDDDDEEEEVTEERRWKPEMGTRAPDEQRDQSPTSTEEGHDEDDGSDVQDVDEHDEYMDMKEVNQADSHLEVNQCGGDCSFEPSDMFNSTEVEGDDLGLSGYVQDNFEFLDQMDCSALDHLECSASYQANEFSVEPPCYSDDDYEFMEEPQASHPAELHLQPEPEAHTQNHTELNRSRLFSTDSYNLHTKSLSLPHMTSPIHRPEESSSEEEAEDDSDEDIYSSDDEDDDESMFVRSLPADLFLHKVSRFEPDSDPQDNLVLDRDQLYQLQISGGRAGKMLEDEFPACEESPAGDQEQMEGEVKGEEDNPEEEEDNPEEKGLTKIEEGGDQLENSKQSKVSKQDHCVEENTQKDKKQPSFSEASPHLSVDYPPASSDESTTADSIMEEGELADNEKSDFLPCPVNSGQTEIPETSFKESGDVSVSSTEPCDREDVDQEDGEETEGMKVYEDIEDMCKEVDIGENDQSMKEETSEDEKEVADIKQVETMQECGKDQNIVVCGTNSDVCKDATEHLTMGVEEQIEKVSGDEMMEADEGWTNEKEVTMKEEEESVETPEERIIDTNMELEEDTTLKQTSEQAATIQGRYFIHNETLRHERKDMISKEKENNDQKTVDEQQSKRPSVALIESDVKEVKESRKFEENIVIQGGVGRKLVITKHPKVFQVKALPIVPPKPQHCRLAALSLRQQQQQQQKERKDEDKWKGNPTEDEGDQGRDGDESEGRMEKPTLVKVKEKREGEERAVRDVSRQSPLSMCFDEAVAIATMRREKEKECEKERQTEWGNEVQ
ncbi:rho GTPase-activating protein 30 [Antennarius striatus]|uniref:rho GTPase-activating protein 30 n=1 Tax=Antennarius striatus TaxID=241820 RepID=UPI0035B4CAE2